ncbi:NAD(P)H-binding protein [Nonomuraea sp. NPDC050556]|uniref:NAD(P)H-binding protein n=1 Tax=Nonomuraea sp. NPDC050556 TaxID=3364369 RepID=UPI003798DD20
MTILVTGARGAVARSLVSLLRERGLQVRTGSQKPEEAAGAVLLDLKNPATFDAALQGVTSVFLYAEASHIDAFVDAAINAGVRHVVLLSSSSTLSPDAADSPVAREHLDAENALTASPLTTTILRPGTFAGNATAWSWPIKSGDPVNLVYPNSHVDPIHEADVAECAFAVLTDPELAGKSYLLTGPRSVTFAEELDLIAEAIGEPVVVNTVGREEWKAEMAEYMPGHFADALLDWWQSNDNVPAEITGTVEELTGHPARGFEVWIQDHAAEFKS